jgi:thiosulfate/3-mercaptopyruvate sulfurtransferase
LEAWEKVLLNGEDYFDTTHSAISCIDCHGGAAGTDDMEAAHEGVVRDPAAEDACATCHSDVVETFGDSLHYDLQGYMIALSERSDEEHLPQVMEAYENHCAGCHATCGQCHVSRPTSAGGGLLAGHVFRSPPPPYTTCTGCHGSRIENEYKGRNEDEEGNRYPADVHYNPGGMNCNDCHTASEMHGADGDFEYRYEGMSRPSCTDVGCHDDIAPGGENEQHSEVHLDKLSCQVCHSTTYKNCYNCHVALSDEGTPFFRTDESEMLFLIGHNPIQSDDRPWEYVPVRHVPVAPDSFAFYGEDLLPNFDSRPTWTYATPHNIQRITPQNESCDGCHGGDTYFLTSERVAEAELQANAAVITSQAWPHPIPEDADYEIPQACVTCHPLALEGDWVLICENMHSLDWEVDPAGSVISCCDCHSEEAATFDWEAAGYSAERAAELTWSDCQSIPELPCAPTETSWVGLAVMALAVANIIAVPLVVRRFGR